MSQSTLLTLIAELKKSRVISIPAAPANRLADPRSLILLSQLIYWTIRDKNSLANSGWLAKPISEWADETLLSRAYLASSLKTLTDRGLVKQWKKSPNATAWLKLSLNQLHVVCHGFNPHSPLTLENFSLHPELVTGKVNLPYFTALANLTGDAVTGLFLSRCVFWQEKLEERNRLKSGIWGWSSHDWSADIGVSRAQLRTAMQRAEKLGFIQLAEIDRPFAGVKLQTQTILASLANTVPKASGVPLLAKSLFSRETANNGTGFVADHCRNAQAYDAQSVQVYAGFEHLNAGFVQDSDGNRQSFDGYRQSTRARETTKDINTTTTTTPSVAQDQSREVVVAVDLIFPSGLSEDESMGIRKHLSKVPVCKQQDLLDEVAGRFLANPNKPRGGIRSIVGLIRCLVDAELSGSLALDNAHLAKAARQKDAQIKASLAKARELPLFGHSLTPRSTERTEQERMTAELAFANIRASMGLRQRAAQ